MPSDARLSSAQRGAYAVEFALVFPLFFLIIYATLTYGLIFTAQQSLNYAAQSGARAALQWQSSLMGRVSAAKAMAESQSNWLVSLGGGPVGIAICGGPSGSVSLQWNGAPACSPRPASSDAVPLRVVVSYPYLKAPLVPLIGPDSLMGFAVPTTLAAAAQVNLAIAQGVGGG